MVTGLTLILNPHWLFMSQEMQLLGVIASKFYAIQIFGTGVLAYVLYKNFVFTKLFKHVILIFMTIQLVSGLYMYSIHQQHLTSILIVGLYLGIACVMLAIYLINLDAFDHDDTAS
jgi:hypothetical protein